MKTRRWRRSLLTETASLSSFFSTTKLGEWRVSGWSLREGEGFPTDASSPVPSGVNEWYSLLSSPPLTEALSNYVERIYIMVGRRHLFFNFYFFCFWVFFRSDFFPCGNRRDGFFFFPFRIPFLFLFLLLFAFLS